MPYLHESINQLEKPENILTELLKKADTVSERFIQDSSKELPEHYADFVKEDKLQGEVINTLIPLVNKAVLKKTGNTDFNVVTPEKVYSILLDSEKPVVKVASYSFPELKRPMPVSGAYYPENTKTASTLDEIVKSEKTKQINLEILQLNKKRASLMGELEDSFSYAQSVIQEFQKHGYSKAEILDFINDSKSASNNQVMQSFDYIFSSTKQANFGRPKLGEDVISMYSTQLRDHINSAINASLKYNQVTSQVDLLREGLVNVI